MKAKIYISNHCTLCREVIRFFQENGIPYEQINVTHNQEKFDEMLMLGGIATPFIIIESSYFYHFDRKKFEKFLEGKYE
ncbi:glutaredoxin family protein [Microaerobacter geothermalis]|uniref:glutaredoxin family protein n=1 Tax=Microaerobacter geothermalis TaxID=674972 RepID=UPI001F31BEF7|nr:glutaredoxin family protein [Microaerobacter geothermalis]MCF6095197.1 glutaredoxin family protein [Microaerobacter geothermalis]